MSNPHEAFYAGCKALAEEAHAGYCQQISPVMYLYGFKHPKGYYDELRLSRDKPQFFEMVILFPIPRTLGIPSLTAWFQDQLRREPVLPAMGVEV